MLSEHYLQIHVLSANINNRVLTNASVNLYNICSNSWKKWELETFNNYPLQFSNECDMEIFRFVEVNNSDYILMVDLFCSKELKLWPVRNYYFWFYKLHFFVYSLPIKKLTMLCGIEKAPKLVHTFLVNKRA